MCIGFNIKSVYKKVLDQQQKKKKRPWLWCIWCRQLFLFWISGCLRKECLSIWMGITVKFTWQLFLICRKIIVLGYQCYITLSKSLWFTDTFHQACQLDVTVKKAKHKIKKLSPVQAFQVLHLVHKTNSRKNLRTTKKQLGVAGSLNLLNQRYKNGIPSRQQFSFNTSSHDWQSIKHQNGVDFNLQQRHMSNPANDTWLH